MTGPDPSITLIAPTFRRPEALARLLPALARQKAPGVPWDLIVIDNDGAPGAAAVFDEHASSFAGRARFVREERRGSAFARNRGIAEASGTITAMVDDDVVPADDWLRVLIAPIIAGRADGTGGRVILDPTVERPRWFDEAIAAYLAHWDLGDGERDLGATEAIVTSNCAFRAELLRATGGFDPALGPRGGTPIVGDDALLTRRFRAVGGTIRWVPDAVVVHELPPERLRPSYLLRRAYAQGRTDWILDRDELARRKFGGARVALSWLGGQLGRRRREGLKHPEVAFHALCDVVRTTGALRESATIALSNKR